MAVDLVISAYRDSLEWVKPLLRPGLCVFCYDKSEDGRYEKDPTPHVYHRLPNVGKLDHTFLHHLCEHYDSLADWTVFSPDGPHDHLGGSDMAGALEPGDSLKVPRLWRGRDWGPDGRLRWHAMTDVPDRNGTNWKDRYESGTITPAALSFVEWMKQFIGFDPNGPDWPGYQPGAILAVPKRAIGYLPREFYERLRDRLSHDREPEEEHYVERAWVVVFTGLARYQPEAVCAIG